MTLPCLVLLLLVSGQPGVFGQDVLPGKKGRLLFHETFDRSLQHWVPEYAEGTNAKIATGNRRLVIDVPGGATVWLKRKLSGNVLIEYRRTVVLAGGVNDRLSDLNQFWMATDPRHASLFTRNGEFEAYDSLQLYYVGVGGNTNTTTRFRKYLGNGERQLLGEFTDPAHLLVANKEYLVSTTVFNGRTTCSLDGKLLFSYNDPQGLTAGYFGFRTTASRQIIRDFRVYELK